MRFLERHKYTLVFLAVVLFCSVLVQYQFLQNEAAHIAMREDFILLHQRGHIKGSEYLYQRLIQSLPRQSLESLIDDFQRTRTLVDTNAPLIDDLLWKYHVNTRNEMTRRAEKRLADLRKRIEQH